jgi:hypothetical protein
MKSAGDFRTRATAPSNGGRAALVFNNSAAFNVVRTAGVEPAQPYSRGILSPLRLPVSPRPLDRALVSQFGGDLKGVPSFGGVRRAGGGVGWATP